MTASEFSTHEAKLEQGTVRYREAGSGEPILFVHGLLVDGRLWTGVAEGLASRFRCIVPDWPMGSHVTPMREDADLSPPGMASTINDFMAELQLDEVTVVANDTGGAITQILVTRHPKRIGRLVLTNCDSHDKFPPFPFNAMPPMARIPGGMTAMTVPFRVGAIRRATYGALVKHPIPRDLPDAWLAPGMRDPAIKRDLRKFITGVHKRYTLEAAERLAGFGRPTLIAWAPEDRFFKLADAERLAETIPDARLETIEDARTFVALDQPVRLAELIGAFAREKSAGEAPVASS